MPRIVDPTSANLDLAAAILHNGGVVAFPTETVYGLGCDTFDPAAIGMVYRLKGRPADNPLIAHVLDLAMASRVADVNDRARSLAQAFWPGPLTLVLSRRHDVPADASGGRGTIAVRSPRHQVARELIERFGSAISAPSANRSGHISPTTAKHVADDFPDADDLMIIDGGAAAIGLESTVIDMTGDAPRLLRPGSVLASEIEAIIGPVESPRLVSQDRSPGTRAGHYAPSIETIALERSDPRFRALCSDGSASLAIVAIETPGDLHPAHHRFAMPDHPVAYAAAMYRVLRTAETSGAEKIVIELPPADDERWQSIRDRLLRAASGHERSDEGRKRHEGTKARRDEAE